MKALAKFQDIFFYRHPCDMREQIIGLSMMVESRLAKDPFSGSLFVFCNRRKNLLKCLYWDRSGFAMWVKQLDAERFPWPRKIDEDVISLTPRQLQWLLEGIDPWKIKRHKTLDYERTY